MILSIEGEPKTGKTTLALTAPLPIVAFSFDLGLERAIYGTEHEKHFAGLDIKVNKYGAKAETGADITIYQLPEPIQLDSNLVVGCLELWEYFIKLVAATIQDSSIRTVVVDTMTLARRVKADAYLQKLQQDAISQKQAPRRNLLQIEYGQVNEAIRQIFAICDSTGKNLVATHHLRDHYVPQVRDGLRETVPDGTLELEGWNDTYKNVDVAIRNEKKGKEIASTIQVCGYALDLEGRSIGNCTWDKLITLIAASTGERIPFDRRNDSSE